jgi:peptidyl-tRNA hydrolase
LTHYVIVRRDLPPGLMAAQIVHAAGESAPQRLPPGTYAIVLAVNGPLDLEALSRRLSLADVRHTVVRESDPPYSGQATAIGVEPALRSVLRRHFSSLPLFRGGT